MPHNSSADTNVYLRELYEDVFLWYVNSKHTLCRSMQSEHCMSVEKSLKGGFKSI